MGDICWSRGIFLKGCVIISVSVLIRSLVDAKAERETCVNLGSRQTRPFQLRHREPKNTAAQIYIDLL
jgi:hypothetical protein